MGVRRTKRFRRGSLVQLLEFMSLKTGKVSILKLSPVSCLKGSTVKFVVILQLIKSRENYNIDSSRTSLITFDTKVTLHGNDISVRRSPIRLP